MPGMESYPDRHAGVSATKISVVVPMYNEADNLPGTLLRIADAIERLGHTFEIVAVNDGSSDETENLLREAAQLHPWLKVVSYTPNRGRGHAQRRGFSSAIGEYILTTDADLSYDPKYLTEMVRTLDEQPEVDFVIGSPYAPGGDTESVPLGRLLISRWGNRVLGFAMPGGIRTVTGILRAYRREVLDSLDLNSDGKEINLEIVSKAVAAGFVPREIPAVLTGRKKGRSKFLLKATVISHLLFSFFERPVMLFGVVGAVLLALGLAGGVHLIYLWQTGNLNPVRPLITLVVILMVSGLQILLFGFLGTQLVRIHRELFRIQRENKQLRSARKEKKPIREPSSWSKTSLDEHPADYQPASQRSG